MRASPNDVQLSWMAKALGFGVRTLVVACGVTGAGFWGAGCGGGTEPDASPESETPNLPAGSGHDATPQVNSGSPSELNGNQEAAPDNSSAGVTPVAVEVPSGSGALHPPQDKEEEIEGTPVTTVVAVSSGSSGDDTATEGNATEDTTTIAGEDVVCSDAGCVSNCAAGFAYYPDLEAERCLKVCDVTNLLPLDSNDDVAALAAQQCEVVEQGLTISGPLVTDLTGLETIRRIGGDFVVQDTSVPSLSGLSGLSQVGMTFVLQGNTELTELGWSTFKSMGSGGLVVLSNPKLLTLSGLSNAVFPAVSVTIVGNGALADLNGLLGLSQGLSVVVAQNDKLANVDGFSSLEHADTLNVTENATLPTFTLTLLGTVGTLTIADNPALTSIVLRCLGASGVVTIQDNPELVSFASTVEATSLTIASNPKLPQCSIERIIMRSDECVNCEGNDTAAVCPE